MADEDEEPDVPFCPRCKVRPRPPKSTGLGYRRHCDICQRARPVAEEPLKTALPQANTRHVVRERDREYRLLRAGLCPDCGLRSDTGSICNRCVTEKAREFSERSEYMATLDPEDKVAGKAYLAAAQGALDARNAAEPPGMPIPHYLHIVRHECAASAGRTTPIELRQVTDYSPAYCVSNGMASEVKRGDRCRGEMVAAGRFRFSYREGQCRHCQLIARSITGRLIDGWSLPAVQVPKGSKSHGRG